MEAGKRSPAGLKLDRIASISAISSSVSPTSWEFSSTRAAVEAPGIGMTVGMPGRLDSDLVQFTASCVRVQPFLLAIVSTRRTSFMLVSKFSGWKRGK